MGVTRAAPPMPGQPHHEAGDEAAEREREVDVADAHVGTLAR